MYVKLATKRPTSDEIVCSDGTESRTAGSRTVPETMRGSPCHGTGLAGELGRQNLEHEDWDTGCSVRYLTRARF